MLARIIYERGLTGTSLGTLALAAGSMDDAAAWLILAVVLASFSGKAVIAVTAIGGGLLYAAAALCVARPLLRRLGASVEREGGISPGAFSFTLTLLMVGAWFTDAVGIYAVLLGPKGESQTHTPPIEFTLSPYSFPFSDNTLLPSGNRFGIYLTRIDDIPDVARIMRLSFVWFPKDFVPPRERPFDLDVGTLPVVAAPPGSPEPDRRSDEGDGT